ncbi:exodeoxyribonuclease VII large subunit [Agarivorans gilvus]|uniref:Exodeoxyribonuclease 7 large subunit n=1 Tax=Agarivorans gilvus TaxID=680279 RepID=A0ABQ1HZA3_9ALTE|nr:exodeoxyribonuclease VII large subunit [Agarivorans gilvus]GGB01327.1 exodeoxyribonuclease 7 large subunit [Agarivorans gilvus]
MQRKQIAGNILSVSQLNQEVRSLLEHSLGIVWLEGEISNFSQPFSGHWYFSLKDHAAQVRCAMFKNANRKVVFSPETGMQVLVKARVTLYEPRGDYQLIVEAIHPAGDGAMQQAYEQLKMKLAAEGLFAQTAKRALVEYPSTVGVVSSLSGAALQDILSVLARRAPAIKVIVYPAAVQGEQAASQLINMINIANQRDEVDVLIVTRGGGSKEDLWVFNDEQLARTIYHSNLPIISAVGHEVDDSISDLVADLRAATPSAAAEIISQQASHIQQRLDSLKHQLSQTARHQFNQWQLHLNKLHHRIEAQSPQHRLEQQQQRFDELSHRLNLALEQGLKHYEKQQQELQQRLNLHVLSKRLIQAQQGLDKLSHSLMQAQHSQQLQRQQHLASLCRQLNSLSPLNVLERGFSLVTHQQKIVKSATMLTKGDDISLRFADGTRKATITH